MDRWLISFSLGAVLSLFLPTTPSLFYVVLFTVLSLFCFFAKQLKWLSALLLGAAWLLLHGVAYHSVWQSNGLEKHKVNRKYAEVVAKVQSIASIKDNTARFYADISTIENKKLVKSIRVRVTWLAPSDIPKQGQLWLFTIKIKPAHGFANPGGFNYLTWLKQQDVHATGFIKNKADNALLLDVVTRREQLYQKFEQYLPIEDSSAIILALTFGDKSKLTKEQWQVLTGTATNHLMAISGLHLGLVALGSYAWLMFLLKVLPIKTVLPKKHRERLAILNSHKLLLVCVLIISTFYAYLAGFSTPTIRALIMMSLFIGARLMSLQLGKLRLLLISLVLIILIMPFSLFSVSFWLSFGAVSLIFLYLWRFPSHRQEQASMIVKLVNYFKALSVFQLYLILVLLPITASLSFKVSIVSVFANLLAVPWLSFVVVPLVLLSLIFSWLYEPIALVLFTLSHYLIELIWAYLSWLNSLAWGQWQLDQYSWLLITLLILIGLMFFVSHARLKLAGMVGGLLSLSLVMMHFSYVSNRTEKWYVDVLDVGQGLAVAIRANNKLLLYDTAASYPSGFSLAESVIMPYMRYHGFTEIDLLVISHDDNDHAGGVAVLEQHFSVNNKMSNQPNTGEPCLKGDEFQWQSLHFTVLHPEIETASHNDDSCVLSVTDGKHSVLLTGDISMRIEQKLLNELPAKLKADVMLVPHHGSKSSSSVPFIHAVDPDIAIFSAGYLNRWRMPSQSVLGRYQQQQVQTLNTAEQGMISVSFKQQKMKIVSYRQDIWPFWFAN